MSCEVNSSKETEARSVLSQRNRDEENHKKQNWALRRHTWNTGASFKTHFMGTSLVVQWLSLCAPNTGAQVPSVIGELDPTCFSQEFACSNLGILHTATKTGWRQIHKNFKSTVWTSPAPPKVGAS